MLHVRLAYQEAFQPASEPRSTSNVLDAVRAVLDRPDDELDYARAKVAFDRLVDPSVDEEWVLGELDRLAGAARKLAGTSPDDAAKLKALRTLIYESGPWNDWRPFAYDMSDPLGRRIRNMLLHNYLATRLGQCVSMPMLYLILGERIGLGLSLATAPDHVFVRYAAPDGRTLNIETTSGALPARDVWIREQFPMTDRAIASGLYLRSLTKREGIALMAAIVLGPLFEDKRFEAAIAVAKTILRNAPRNLNAMLSLASAYGQLADGLREKHPTSWTLPSLQRAQLWACIERNRSLFAAAERLGWTPLEKENTTC